MRRGPARDAEIARDREEKVVRVGTSSQRLFEMSDGSRELVHLEVQPRETHESAPRARQLGETMESGA